MKLQTKAFTLVELIVVITILAVLSTIWFVSYSWYLAWTRDTNRISQLKAISDWLHLFSTNHSLPTPDDNIDVKAHWKVIAIQWYAWKNTLETITYSTPGLDPKDKTYFSYYLTRDKKYFQLMTFLEEEDSLQTAWIFNNTKAVDYSIRYPAVFWDKLWILTDEFNVPVQEIAELKSAKFIDLWWTNSWTLYKAHYEDGRVFSFSWYILNDKLHTLSNPWIYWARKDCPDWFIGVWWDSQYNQPGFCVAQYEMTYKDWPWTPTSIKQSWEWNTYTYDSTKAIVSKKWDYPVVELTIAEAISACMNMWDWYHLMTNNEWMAITRSIELTKENWSSWEVWDWFLYNWVSNDSMWCWEEQTNVIFPDLSRKWATKTWMWSNNSCNDKRKLMMLNWAVIWDLAWNVWEFVNKANTLDGANYYSLPESNVQFSSTVENSWEEWDHDEIDFSERYEYWPIIALNSINWVWSVFDLKWGSDNIFERWWSADDNDAWIFALSLRAYNNLWYKNASVWFRCAYMK